MAVLAASSVALTPGCTTSTRSNNPQVVYIPQGSTQLDEYSYRLGERGALKSRPREFTLTVDRSRACVERVAVQKTYAVRSETEFPDSSTWMLILGGAGLGGGLLASQAFKVEEGGDTSDESIFADPWIAGSLGAGVGVILSLLFPTGTSYSSSEEVERGEVTERRNEACTPYAPAAGEQIEVVMASGQSLPIRLDGNGRATFEVDVPTWKAASEGMNLGEVVLPSGARSGIDVTSTLREHAAMVVDRAKRQQKPPLLEVFASFEDTTGNGNEILDAGESAALVLRVENRGGGTAYAVRARFEVLEPSGELELERFTTLGEIDPGTSKVERVVLRARDTLPTGRARIGIILEEEMGFGSRAPVEMHVRAQKLEGPQLRVAGYEIFDGTSAWAQGDGRKTITPGEQIELRLQAANVGEGTAEDVEVSAISRTEGVSFVRESVPLGRVLSGQSKNAVLVFRVQPKVTAKVFEPLITFSERRKQFNRSEALSLPMEQTMVARNIINVSSMNDQSEGARCPSATNWVIAVMSMKDLRAKETAGAKDLESLTRQLHLLATRRGLTTVDRSVQARELDKIVREAKQESYKECYDESCQIELGKALAASHLLVSELDSFGEECTLGWQVLDLSQEATICAWRERGRCDSGGLLDLAESASNRLPRGR